MKRLLPWLLVFMDATTGKGETADRHKVNDLVFGRAEAKSAAQPQAATPRLIPRPELIACLASSFAFSRATT